MAFAKSTKRPTSKYQISFKHQLAGSETGAP